MLGEHCDDCGNPLFRVDDEVVCAVCGGGKGEETVVGDAEDQADVGDVGGEGLRGSRSTGARGSRSTGGAEDGAVREVRENLSRVVHRLSKDAADEDDLSRLDRQLDALQKAVDLLERL